MPNGLPREAAPGEFIDGGCLTAGATAPASPLLSGGAAPVGGRGSNPHEANDAINLTATPVRTIKLAGCTQKHRSACACLHRKTVGLSSILLLACHQRGGGANYNVRSISIARLSALSLGRYCVMRAE